MPELPEVETVRRGVAPLVTGCTITGAILRADKLRWEIDPELGRRLKDEVIRRVERRAKYLLFRLESATLVIHLGMSGVLRVVASETPIKKHDHVDILLDDGNCLRLNDTRRFGAVVLVEGELQKHPLFQALGPEPLSDDFNSENLFFVTRNRRVAIKNLLMNQATVVGVGNIYACEALFAAGIDPQREAADLDQDECGRLLAAVKSILAKAIEEGGTTIRDFAGSDGKPGYFKQQLQVYGRQGEPCVSCHATIRNIRLGGRSTFFCASCQK